MSHIMKAATLWTKAKAWGVAHDIPHNAVGAHTVALFRGFYGGHCFSVLGISPSHPPILDLNAHGEWIIFYEAARVSPDRT